MTSYRVIVSGNSSDGFEYSIKQMCAVRETFDGKSVHPFVNNGMAVSGTSLVQLRETLTQMLKACELPILALKTETKIIEAQGPAAQGL